jgi:exosortase A-associated hydrolase 2
MEAPQPIESAGTRLYAMLYAPAGAAAGAAVFCAPLFEERKSAERTMVDAARALCADGIAVLRFDYRGCGDSGGEFEDFGPRDWEADVRAARRWLAARFPGVPVGLLGLRLGAALAACAAPPAGDGPGADFLLLWEPVAGGREHLEQELRRKLVKEMMTFGRSVNTREDLVRRMAEGGTVDFDGYAVTGRLFGELGELDPAGAAGRFGGPVGLVSIAHHGQATPGARRLAEAFGAPRERVAAAAVRLQAFWSLVGHVDGTPLIEATRRLAGELLARCRARPA